MSDKKFEESFQKAMQATANPADVAVDAGPKKRAPLCPSTLKTLGGVLKCARATGHSGLHHDRKKKFPGGSKSQPWGTKRNEWH